jgi:hypothetical protein
MHALDAGGRMRVMRVRHGSRTVLLMLALAMLALAAGTSCDTREAPAAAPDSAPPTVALLSPVAGGIVADTVCVRIEAADAAGIQCVTLLVDSLACGTRYGPPWSIRWSTGHLPDSSFHILQAEAIDRAGNRALSSPHRVCVRRNRAPSVRILRPGDGEWIDLADTAGTWLCEACDPEEGLLAGDRIVWLIDGDSLSGRGATRPAPVMTEGAHAIVARGSDRWGRSGLARCEVTAFRYPARDCPEAALEVFLDALRARDPDAAAGALAEAYRGFGPQTASHSPDWSAQRERAAIGALLRDERLTRLSVSAHATPAEIFTLRGRTLAKIELSDLEIATALRCDAADDPRSFSAPTVGVAALEDVRVSHSHARVFLERGADAAAPAAWQIVAWWDMHGASRDAGTLSWTALKRAAEAGRLCARD